MAYGPAVTLQDCAVIGNVDIGSSNGYGGGVLGFGNGNFTLSATGCYFSGQIGGSSNKYGFAYVSKSGTRSIEVSDCFYDNEKNLSLIHI